MDVEKGKNNLLTNCRDFVPSRVWARWHHNFWCAPNLHRGRMKVGYDPLFEKDFSEDLNIREQNLRSCFRIYAH